MAYDYRNAELDTILRVTVGSTVHGTAVEGTDDRDELAVFIPPPHYVLGLERVETIVHRTQPWGVRSGPGDLDLTLHSLAKFCRLALRGNPSVLLAFYSPAPLVAGPLGQALRALAPEFASKRAVRAFLGFMGEQRKRLTGEKGQKGITRPELVERYGYDTKYAGHVIRLGLQGLEYARTGRLTLPMAADDAELVLRVRRGEVTLDAVLAQTDILGARLEGALEGTPLPDEPNAAVVEDFLVDATLAAWGYVDFDIESWPRAGGEVRG